jgi:hypothetical protein
MDMPRREGQSNLGEDLEESIWKFSADQETFGACPRYDKFA